MCKMVTLHAEDLDRRRRNALLQWGALMALLLALLVSFFLR